MGRLASAVLACFGIGLAAGPGEVPTSIGDMADMVLREVGFAGGLCLAMGYGLAVWFYCQRTAYWQRGTLYAQSPS